jgi:RNA polymerase sigma-70 factor (family 1)
LNAALNNDHSLLEQMQSGSEQAFTQLYMLYSERLYYNILAMVKDAHTAEEILQDVFADIWHKRQTIKITQSFAGYLFVTSRNRVYDFLRQAARDQELSNRIKAIATEHYSHIEEALLAKENTDLLQKAIAALPPQRRRAFELCKLDGLSYKEVSEIMGISLSTVKDHMANARESIRAYVANNREVGIGIVFFCLWHAR